MKCHEIDYQIFGSDLQFVEVELDPGEVVVAEAGAMLYMEDGIGFETTMGDGSKPNQGFFGKLFSAGQRMLTGESVFMTHFKNNGQGKTRVSFAAPYPGKIVPVNLADIPGGELLCQKDAFLCAALGTEITMVQGESGSSHFRYLLLLREFLLLCQKAVNQKKAVPEVEKFWDSIFFMNYSITFSFLFLLYADRFLCYSDLYSLMKQCLYN